MAAEKSKPASTLKFTVAKMVTLGLLSMKSGDVCHIRMDSGIYQGKPLKGDVEEAERTGKAAKEPAHLARVTDLDTGEYMQMIIPAVLLSTLSDEYPVKDGVPQYVGKCFEVTHNGKTAKGGAAGTGYNTFSISEITVDGEMPPSPPGSEIAASVAAGDASAPAKSTKK